MPLSDPCTARKKKDLTGKVFGNLTVIEQADYSYTPQGHRLIMWSCRCCCGKVFPVYSGNLLKGNTKSCGCIKGKHRHSGHSNISPTYRSWNSLRQRCYNPKYDNYDRYGGAGVEVCDRWLISKGGSFENFLEDMGERPEGTTLNRINGAKLYSKETCEWATNKIQGFDKKTYIQNKSGKSGVYWCNIRNKWEVSISVDGKKLHLGRYDVLEEAIKVREDAELKHYGFLKDRPTRQTVQTTLIEEK